MISLETAKQHLRVESDIDDDDDYITTLISAAYQYAERQTGRIFTQRTETLVLDRFHPDHPFQPHRVGRPVVLPWTPVQAVTAVTYVNPDGETQTLDVSTLRLDTRPLYPVLSPQYGSDWPAVNLSPESITITAAVGYTADDEPKDVQMALLLFIGHLYTNREAVTNTTVNELPIGVDALLAPYIIHRVGNLY